MLLWGLTPRGLVERYKCFEGTYRCHLQGWYKQYVPPKRWYLPERPHGEFPRKITSISFRMISTKLVVFGSEPMKWPGATCATLVRRGRYRNSTVLTRRLIARTTCSSIRRRKGSGKRKIHIKRNILLLFISSSLLKYRTCVESTGLQFKRDRPCFVTPFAVVISLYINCLNVPVFKKVKKNHFVTDLTCYKCKKNNFFFIWLMKG